MTDRRVFLVGKFTEARLWKAEHKRVPESSITVLTTPLNLRGLDPRKCWFVMLPSFWDLDNREHLLKAVRQFEARGAHVEWP